ALPFADGATLHALLRVGSRTLVGTLGEADALEPHREARLIHHDEHVLEAAILLADEVTGRAAVIAVGEHRGRARMNTELMLERHTVHVVARAQRAVCIDHKLRHDEKRDALHAP